MRTFKLKVRETHVVEHVVSVPNTFKPYDEASLNDWANEIAEQNSEPTETFDIQVESVVEAEEIISN